MSHIRLGQVRPKGNRHPWALERVSYGDSVVITALLADKAEEPYPDACGLSYLEER
jgi:hypothetical protein